MTKDLKKKRESEGIFEQVQSIKASLVHKL
jgi:hypothetical protein